MQVEDVAPIKDELLRQISSQQVGCYHYLGAICMMPSVYMLPSSSESHQSDTQSISKRVNVRQCLGLFIQAGGKRLFAYSFGAKQEINAQGHGENTGREAGYT